MIPKRTNCINCGGPLEAGLSTCIYCGTTTQRENQSLFDHIFKNRSYRVNGIYPILLGLGIIIMLYIYLIAFDDFSETQLVTITPLWFFFITFGIYGYFAEYLMKQVIDGKGVNLKEAYKKWVGKYLRYHFIIGIILIVVLAPFSLIRTRNSLLIAFAGSLMWGILLLIFFQAIFPSL
jgi:hypothetical protein